MDLLNLSKRAKITFGIMIAITLICIVISMNLAAWRVAIEKQEALQTRSSFGSFGDGLWWGENQDTVVLGWPKSPTSLPRPTFLALIHWPKGNLLEGTPTDFSWNSGNTDPATGAKVDWHSELKATITLPEGRKVNVRHFATGDEKKPTETFEADGKVLNAANGRLFLIDLSGPQPSVVQLPSDLKGAIPEPADGSGPTLVDAKPILREALAKLQEKHPEVRKFLEGSALK